MKEKEGAHQCLGSATPSPCCAAQGHGTQDTGTFPCPPIPGAPTPQAWSAAGGENTPGEWGPGSSPG